MWRFSAIHLRLTVVSSRSRRASATLVASPLRRRFSSSLVQPTLLSSSCTIRSALASIDEVFSPFSDGLGLAGAAQSRFGPHRRVYGDEEAREARWCNSELALLYLRVTEPLG